MASRESSSSKFVKIDNNARDDKNDTDFVIYDLNAKFHLFKTYILKIDFRVAWIDILHTR